jgi:hypothetical protein
MHHKNGVTEFAADGSLLVTDRGLKFCKALSRLKEKSTSREFKKCSKKSFALSEGMGQKDRQGTNAEMHYKRR